MREGRALLGHLRAAGLLTVLLVFASCAQNDVLPRGEQAYALTGNPDEEPAQVYDYRIGALDTISITVFQEPDLSAEEIVVDAAGLVSLPLIGSVQAAGRTTSELAAEIEQRYGARYLVNPQVAVGVSVAVSQQVTVEGNVQQAGSFPIQGRMTLLRALALAQGPTRVAGGIL